ncbi:MAG: hypothetical protein A2504_08810 [Bdellovibrionales bacterium RIFOXYD12_FULL_39_22]|nr:MAG: hypothetical protein A2385_13325 [Bdellovibrionales bacterium RIFOXYB1_FULL_39_21]OFZ40929.1 MAG: hypothetical protein A2485_16420 [Bdellovibrionales bacterium RIFOXYC12_FULL_39_17]OFZ44727.1 MAG: hypothetical protein A2404_10700 [Bdellovibrionales bacterium RIFOXYC1_FULL_39_130]OFZ74178.1 MAG: hypothetical protein A2560_03365 [Bdellovibrionales bacterium RIFOXYD1_FULL_39_84]OFZ92058.1 MAG: hypothetical protein A2504_08810 [Bdellovibrionales bacterium RIFOXYD12_FULL_39_22]HLE10623.1 hy
MSDEIQKSIAPEAPPERAQYTKINIKALELYASDFQIDIFLRLSQQKFVKVCKREDSQAYSKSIIEKYKAKGIIDMYLETEDYVSFVSSIRQILTSKIRSAEAAGPAQQLGQLSVVHDVIKVSFNEGYINADTIALAKELTSETANSIAKIDIFEKYAEFKANCSGEYLHALLSSYLACAMAEEFSWCNSEVKQKIVLGALLCDVTLSPEDFKEMREKKNNITELSKKILDHPLNIALRLQNERDFISKETLAIIREHHERPNGKGYPHGVNYGSVTVLTAIYIIANYFIEQMFDQSYQEDFKQEKMDRIVELIKEKFYSGNYRKASDALEKIYHSRFKI